MCSACWWMGIAIWAGTENGLGLYENQQVEDIHDQGRAGASRSAFAGARQAHGRCVGRDDGRVEPHLRRAHRHLHAVEFGTEQRRGVRRFRGRRERVGGDGCGRLQARSAHRRSGRSTTNATRRWSRSGCMASLPRRPRCTTRCGAAGCWSTTRRRSCGTSTTIPTARTEMVLFKDQGLIHEITTSVSYVDNILWVATYFGDSRYDGRYWHNFLDQRQRASLELYQCRERRGRQTCVVWHRQGACLLRRRRTGLSTVRLLLQGKPEMTVRDAKGKVSSVAVTHGAGAQLCSGN